MFPVISLETALASPAHSHYVRTKTLQVEPGTMILLLFIVTGFFVKEWSLQKISRMRSNPEKARFPWKTSKDRSLPFTVSFYPLRDQSLPISDNTLALEIFSRFSTTATRYLPGKVYMGCFTRRNRPFSMEKRHRSPGYTSSSANEQGDRSRKAPFREARKGAGPFPVWPITFPHIQSDSTSAR